MSSSLISYFFYLLFTSFLATSSCLFFPENFNRVLPDAVALLSIFSPGRLVNLKILISITGMIANNILLIIMLILMVMILRVVEKMEMGNQVRIHWPINSIVAEHFWSHLSGNKYHNKTAVNRVCTRLNELMY